MTLSINVAASAAPDPFDPVSLRLPQDYAAECGVRKLVTTVPVRKPEKSWFVRVNPSEEMRLNVKLLELRDEGETYLVTPPIHPELEGESAIRKFSLFTAVNRQGVLFLWKCRLPETDGKFDEWVR